MLYCGNVAIMVYNFQGSLGSSGPVADKMSEVGLRSQGQRAMKTEGQGRKDCQLLPNTHPPPFPKHLTSVFQLGTKHYICRHALQLKVAI